MVNLLPFPVSILVFLRQGYFNIILISNPRKTQSTIQRSLGPIPRGSVVACRSRSESPEI